MTAGGRRRDEQDTWTRRAALGVIGLAALICLARATRLVAPPDVSPGPETVASLDFFRATIPQTAGYLYVEPGAFGTDTGAGQRLRYELYPRTYDDVRYSEDEGSVRDLMRAEHLTYILVPAAAQYAPTSWLRQPSDWLQRIELDADRYVLAVVAS